jgi:hypothetical protein
MSAYQGYQSKMGHSGKWRRRKREKGKGLFILPPDPLSLFPFPSVLSRFRLVALIKSRDVIQARVGVPYKLVSSLLVGDYSDSQLNAIKLSNAPHLVFFQASQKL